MNNQAFLSMAHDARQCKLSAALRSRTNNALSQEQLAFIMQSIVPDFQYAIAVYTEPSDFCNALTLGSTETISDRGKIVFGRTLFGKTNEFGSSPGRLFDERNPAAALITRFTDALPKNAMRTILVYVPAHHDQKGMDAYERQCV